MGVPAVWAPSPDRPELEYGFPNWYIYCTWFSSDDDEVVKRREEAKLLSSLADSDSDYGMSCNWLRDKL